MHPGSSGFQPHYFPDRGMTKTSQRGEGSNKPEQLPPLVSVGMPVRNEDRFLEESLHSLLAQDYVNLEIIISDNASTDRTAAICRTFSMRDRRVHYHRFDTNHGAAENFKRVVTLAQGKYFMWAAGHDLWSPNLVSECVRQLENEPDGVIAFGCCTWIDAAGRKMARSSGWIDTRGMVPSARFFSVFWGNMQPIYGVIKTGALKKVPFLSCIGTDLLILSELTLVGHFIHATTAEWKRRDFRDLESYRDRMQRYCSSQFGLSRSFLDRLFPTVRLPLEIAKIVLRSRVSWLEKVGMLLILLVSLPLRYIIGRQERIDRVSSNNN